MNNLNCKFTNLLGENKKLQAENEVLEKALEHGVGRKAQRKLQELEGKLEAAQQMERLAQAALQRLAQDTEKLEAENSRLTQLVKTGELELKRVEKRLFEESLRTSRTEEKFMEFKEKAANTLAKSMQKNELREEKFNAMKVQTDRKLNDIVNLLEKKQSQIDGFLMEKK